MIGDGVYDDERVTTFEPGVFKYLAPGGSVSVPAINKDQSATYADYIRASLRAFSAGLGCSAESVMNDYSQSNYSSSRLALQNERETTFEPGVFKYLAPGESVSVPAINKDQSATYADYIRASLRAFSAG